MVRDIEIFICIDRLNPSEYFAESSGERCPNTIVLIESHVTESTSKNDRNVQHQPDSSMN